MTTGKGERRTEGGQLRLVAHAGLVSPTQRHRRVIPPGNKPPHSGDAGRAREGRQAGHAGCGADPGLPASARARRTCRSSAGLRGRALAPVTSAPAGTSPPSACRAKPAATLSFASHLPEAHLPPRAAPSVLLYLYLRIYIFIFYHLFAATQRSQVTVHMYGACLC